MKFKELLRIILIAEGSLFPDDIIDDQFDDVYDGVEKAIQAWYHLTVYERNLQSLPPFIA